MKVVGSPQTPVTHSQSVCLHILEDCNLQISVKLPSTKFREISFTRSRVVTCRQTDQHGKVNMRIYVAFLCDRSKIRSNHYPHVFL
jgi:hypothetical protein